MRNAGAGVDCNGVAVRVGLGCAPCDVAAGEVLARAEIEALQARWCAVSAGAGDANWLAQFVLARALRAAHDEFLLLFNSDGGGEYGRAGVCNG
jgi:hypothetical protein